MKIDLQRIGTDFAGNYCYTHARGGIFPDGFAVITTQPLRLSGCDIFYGMEMLTSADAGRTWSPIVKSATLTRRKLADGSEQTLSDATPMYHRATGKMLLVGHEVLYIDDEIMPPPRPRHTLWSVFDRAKRDWAPFRQIDMPDNEKFFACGCGCGQYTELANGDLLIPVYFNSRKEGMDPQGRCSHVMVMRCTFDGTEIHLVEYGNSITVAEPRGLGEPSIVPFAGKYFLALRNDVRGYVAASDDGLTIGDPVPLMFDDGKEVGNYNTQQHWLTCGGKLYMVYTRRGANNDHVFRHRAPLFIAEFDPGSMRLRRDTEAIAVPERGARLGNFGCVQVSENEAWVVASEWMQTNPPNPRDWRVCMKYGSDNSIFIARITA